MPAAQVEHVSVLLARVVEIKWGVALKRVSFWAEVQIEASEELSEYALSNVLLDAGVAINNSLLVVEVLLDKLSAPKLTLDKVIAIEENIDTGE